jgi:hypothetical protein
MQAAPTRPLNVRALYRVISSEDPSIEEVDVDAALTWHFGQGNVVRVHNHELGLDEYTLTARGLKA